MCDINIDKIIDLVKEKHGKQTRSDNKTPYYIHPLTVSELLKSKGFNQQIQIIALCHDLLEDTSITEKELLDYTDSDIVDVVKLLTKVEGYSNDDYYHRIMNNEQARIVKLADRLNNLQDVLSTNLSFMKRYYEETNKYFLKIALNTCFEVDIIKALRKLEEEIKRREGIN